MAPSQPAGSPPSWRLPVPAAFAAGVVQQSGEVGAAWLPALPDLLATLLQDWHLVPDGTVRHGYLGIVVPVRRDAAPCVVEVGRPSAEVDNQAASLSAWDGRGMVGLTADPSRERCCWSASTPPSRPAAGGRRPRATCSSTTTCTSATSWRASASVARHRPARGAR